LDDLRSPKLKSGTLYAEIPQKRHTVDIDKKFENFEKSFNPTKKPPQNNERAVKKTAGGFNKIIYALLSLGVVVLLLITFVFNKAKVVLTPRVESVDNNAAVVITNNLQKNFEIVEIVKTDTKQIPKSESKKVATKSSGKITIYNNYSEATQKLIKNTRFETKDGKIFRITDSIVIPGKTSSGPGSVVADVFADAVGADYNIAPTTFTIPGFKNTARYTGFYAESKDYMKGGASGNVDVVAVEDIDAAKSELTTKLEQELEKEIRSINKDGFVGVYSNIIYDVADNKNEMLVNGSNEYKISVKSRTLFLRQSAIASAIAYKNINGFNGESVRVKDFSTINISLSESVDLLATSSVPVEIVGKSDLIYQIDQTELKERLASKSKTDFVEILKDYKNEIYSAKSNMFPVWLQRFPSNLKKIEIEESLQ
jgi:hypothetical protein